MTTTIRAYRPCVFSLAPTVVLIAGDEQPDKPQGPYVYQIVGETAWRNSTGTVVEVSE